MKPSTKILTKAYKKSNKDIDIITAEIIPKNFKLTLENNKDNLYYLNRDTLIFEILRYLDEALGDKK